MVCGLFIYRRYCRCRHAIKLYFINFFLSFSARYCVFTLTNWSFFLLLFRLFPDELHIRKIDMAPQKKFIFLKVDALNRNGDSNSLEDYEIEMSAFDETVIVHGASPAGVFYGVQSLLSMATGNPNSGYSMRVTFIKDGPRYPYRGVQIDVARNFHPKSDILKLLDVMAMYKMNKLHMHLTDDEGWRLEIPGLPELISVS